MGRLAVPLALSERRHGNRHCPLDDQQSPDRVAKADPHPAPPVIPTLLAFGVATAFLTTEPWLTLTVVGIVYVGSVPLTIRAYFRLKRAAEARKAEFADKPEPMSLPTPAPFPLGDANAPSTEWRH